MCKHLVTNILNSGTMYKDPKLIRVSTEVLFNKKVPSFDNFSCPFDRVTIYDGPDNLAEKIGTYCGQMRNLVIYSTKGGSRTIPKLSHRHVLTLSHRHPLIVREVLAMQTLSDESEPFRRLTLLCTYCKLMLGWYTVVPLCHSMRNK